MSVPPRSLTLEVWLGPMEGLRYAAEARQAMQLVRIGRLPFDRQTKDRNHLVLSVSAGVSGSHAEVRFAQGRIFLRDLGSSNGTFAAQQAVTAETEVKSGEIFLVSLTPVQVYLTSPLAAPPPFEPLPVTHWEGAAVEPLVTTAAECAASRREAYIDTRHLLDAILRLDDPEIDELLAQGGVTRRAAREELYKKAFYRESLSWIAEILVKPANLTGTLETVVVSPRVARLLDGARAAVSTEADPAEGTRLAARNILAGLVADRFGPVGDWLADHGITSVPASFGSTSAGGDGPASSPEKEADSRPAPKPVGGKGRTTTLLSEAIGDATASAVPRRSHDTRPRRLRPLRHLAVGFGGGPGAVPPPCSRAGAFPGGGAGAGAGPGGFRARLLHRCRCPRRRPLRPRRRSPGARRARPPRSSSTAGPASWPTSSSSSRASCGSACRTTAAAS